MNVMINGVSYTEKDAKAKGLLKEPKKEVKKRKVKKPLEKKIDEQENRFDDK